jgi:hypothetical protein
MKWGILLYLPNYLMNKQSKIILACCTALRNFIHESAMRDQKLFDLCNQDEEYANAAILFFSRNDATSTSQLDNDEDVHMNAFRDSMANTFNLDRRINIQGCKCF